MKILSLKWLMPLVVPLGLIVLCVVPVLAGMVRMAQLASAAATPENARFFASPLPVIFGSGMLVSLCLGLMTIRRHDYTKHRNRMMRAHTIGMGAGTQVFTNLPWILLAGTPGVFTRSVLMGAGWVINLAVVEWLILPNRNSLQLPIIAA
jgi:Predicted membrane protein (DUF2306)